jgi:Chemotaxis protein histidine kinase and related kinases
MGFEDNKDIFLEEARDFLARIETSLLALEQSPGDSELINDIFRGLHTIKGSGAMFGYDEVSAFAHGLESLFDDVRKGGVPVDSRLVELGLRSVDCVSKLLGGEDCAEEEAAIGAEIERIRDGGASGVPTSTPSAAPAAETIPVERDEAPSGLPSVWRIEFRPQRLIFLRGVKVELLVRELEELGTCHVQAIVDEVPTLEGIDPTSCYLWWRFVLSTAASLQRIRGVFMFVEDYSELSFEPIELREEAGRPVVPRIGEILKGRGQLDDEGVEEIRQAQKPFGETAVESGKVRQDAVDGALAEQAIIRSAHIEREARQEAATVRVRKEKLDGLVDLVGELVILQAILRQEAQKSGSGAFGALSENLARLSSDLRDAVMGIRMVPLAESFGTFQRLVHDLSRQVGKELVLELSGADTELDKNVIELLKDPLVHIIRNSADHGIEAPEEREKMGKPRAGRIAIDARQVGHRVEIAISDDGRGLDIAKIRNRAVQRRLLDPSEADESRIMAMIFEPGFSTAESATDISGRGVGMDVVKRNIERLRGEVRLESAQGKGLTVILSIPLTLVIVDGLLVRVAGVDYVIALGLVNECVDAREGGDAMSDLGIIRIRGKTIPVIDLRECLSNSAGEAENEDARLVIVTVDGEDVALKVDMIVGKQQVVIKPFTASLKGLASVSGATILGDGSVALILNVAELVKASQTIAVA